MHNRNQSEMLPYEKLAVLGIDREKADSLPIEVKEKLVAGEVTPLMQVSISAQNGDVITIPLKLQLTTDQNGAPALMAYPVRAALEVERNQALRLTEQEAERLTKGEVIQKAVVKTIVDSHRGELVVDSELGRGTRMGILMDSADGDEQQESPTL